LLPVAPARQRSAYYLACLLHSPCPETTPDTDWPSSVRWLPVEPPAGNEPELLPSPWSCTPACRERGGTQSSPATLRDRGFPQTPSQVPFARARSSEKNIQDSENQDSGQIDSYLRAKVFAPWCEPLRS